jgi:hypothetical protein
VASELIVLNYNRWLFPIKPHKILTVNKGLQGFPGNPDNFTFNIVCLKRSHKISTLSGEIVPNGTHSWDAVQSFWMILYYAMEKKKDWKYLATIISTLFIYLLALPSFIHLSSGCGAVHGTAYKNTEA